MPILIVGRLRLRASSRVAGDGRRGLVLHLLGVVGLARGGSGLLRASSDLRSGLDLFLLGSAFLLLETRSIPGFALLFGTTWIVNAVVFAGVLLAGRAAGDVTRRSRTPTLRGRSARLAGWLAIGPSCGPGSRPTSRRSASSSSERSTSAAWVSIRRRPSRTFRSRSSWPR